MSAGPLSDALENLGDPQLLALLLGASSPHGLELSLSLLGRFGDLRSLACASATELREVPGIGPARMARLTAAIEVGRRIGTRRWKPGQLFSSSRQVFAHCHGRLRDLRHERFVGFYLNAKNRLVGEREISRGSLVASLVHPREVFRPAVELASAGVICVHNHPSGDPMCSPQDVAMTRRLYEAGEIVGIDLIDHIIIGDGAYFSFVDRRVPPFDKVVESRPGMPPTGTGLKI